MKKLYCYNVACRWIWGCGCERKKSALNCASCIESKSRGLLIALSNLSDFQARIDKIKCNLKKLKEKK